jgi:hypothetical protein
MNTATIRKQLQGYLEVANDKKVNAIYTMVEDEIKEIAVEYSEEFKEELNKRVNYYLEGGKMVSPAMMKKRLQTLRKKRKS